MIINYGTAASCKTFLLGLPFFCRRDIILAVMNTLQSKFMNTITIKKAHDNAIFLLLALNCLAFLPGVGADKAKRRRKISGINGVKNRSFSFSKSLLTYYCTYVVQPYYIKVGMVLHDLSHTGQ